MNRLAIRVVCAAILIVAASGSWAVPLTDAQLYYDPWQVPPANYPTIDLASTSTGTSVSYAWPETDVQGVQVLPLLRQYSTADPAGYPPGYAFSQSDYEYQPNVDYSVDLTAGVATATFSRSGVYHVKVDRTSSPDVVYAVLVDSGYLGGDTGASTDIDGPTADLVVVSKPTGGDSTLDKAAGNAEDDNGAAKVKRASDKDDAVAKIKAASEAAGKKIHVELVCHGSPGSLRLGDTKIGGTGADMSVEDFQKAIDPYVNNLSIYACNFAEGADGDKAMQTLADSLGMASAFTGWVSVHRSDHWWWSSGSWDLQIGRKKKVVISLAPIIRDIKDALDGFFSYLPGATVTAVFPESNSFYVKADNRACGIMVCPQLPLPPTVSPGLKLDIYGQVQTDLNRERYVNAFNVVPAGTGRIDALGLTTKSLGGGPFGLQQGVVGGTGLNNIGLLVRVSGEYTAMNPSTFLLTDGGRFVKCLLPPGVTISPMFGHATVTGISSCERNVTGISSVIKVRNQQDIVPL